MKYCLGRMEIFLEKDYDSVSTRAAEIVAKQIIEKPNGVMGFATGSTPIGTYEKLIEMYKNNKIDFSNITTFNLDEYYPIEKSNDQSYDYFMRHTLFDHVNLDYNKFNIPNGETEDVDSECIAYEDKIKKAGGIDLQILGIGLDGHIGFNEPEPSFPAATHVSKLEESTIEANARFFANEEEVPKLALTMGIGTIMHSKKILLIVSGSSKAKILKETVLGPVVPSVPASILQFHQNVTIIADKAAAAELNLV